MTKDNLWKKVMILQIIKSPRFLCVFFALWAAVILLSGIRYGDLSGYDDAAYAHEAKVLMQTGNIWTLNLNGNPDFDKPPLFIWLLAISFKILGISDFSAKLPGVVLGWATIVVLYLIVKELFTEDDEDESNRFAGLAMLVLATTQYFLKYASHAMTDVPFTFFFTLSIYFYLRGLKNDRFLPASGIAVGLSMMMRSPMGFFPLVIIVLHLFYLRRFKLLGSPYFIAMIIFSVALPATWYLTEYRLYGGTFINLHFFNFMAHSGTSAASSARNSWQQFLWYFEYVFLLVRLYLPWFPLMIYGLLLSVRRLRNDPASADALLFIWLLVVFIPFSLVDSKILRYILPVFPVLSIYSAFALKKIFSPRKLIYFSQTAVLLLSLAAIYIVFFPHYKERAEDMKIIAPISDAASKPEEKIILFTSGQLQGNFLNQLIWYGNRKCLFITDLNSIENLLTEKGNLLVVMDNASFFDFSPPPNSQTIIIGESEKFTCFRLLLSE